MLAVGIHRPGVGTASRCGGGRFSQVGGRDCVVFHQIRRVVVGSGQRRLGGRLGVMVAAPGRMFPPRAQVCCVIRSRRSWLLICKRLPILFGRFVLAVLALAVSGATSPRWRFCFAGLPCAAAVMLAARWVGGLCSRFSSSNYAWSQNDWQQNPLCVGFRVPWRFQALHLDAGVPRCVALSRLPSCGRRCAYCVGSESRCCVSVRVCLGFDVWLWTFVATSVFRSSTAPTRTAGHQVQGGGGGAGDRPQL